MKNNDRVLVLKDKYSTRIFRASTEEELHQSSLKILQSKVDNGYISPPENTFDGYLYSPRMPTFSQEEIAKLPDGEIKDIAIKERRLYDDFRLEREDNERLWNKVQSALQNKNGKDAFRIIMSRRDYEYEGIDFVDLE